MPDRATVASVYNSSCHRWKSQSLGTSVIGPVHRILASRLFEGGGVAEWLFKSTSSRVEHESLDHMNMISEVGYHCTSQIEALF